MVETVLEVTRRRMRPSTWLARCGQSTDGLIKKRLRQTISCRWPRRCPSFHPAVPRCAAAANPAAPPVRRAHKILAAGEGRRGCSRAISVTARSIRSPTTMIPNARAGTSAAIPTGEAGGRLSVTSAPAGRSPGAQRPQAAGKLQTAARVDKGKLLADDPEPTGCRTAHRTAATQSAQLLPRPAMCG